jgi:hypothetical protein
VLVVAARAPTLAWGCIPCNPLRKLHQSRPVPPKLVPSAVVARSSHSGILKRLFYLVAALLEVL